MTRHDRLFLRLMLWVIFAFTWIMTVFCWFIWIRLGASDAFGLLCAIGMTALTVWSFRHLTPRPPQP